MHSMEYYSKETKNKLLTHANMYESDVLCQVREARIKRLHCVWFRNPYDFLEKGKAIALENRLVVVRGLESEE